jgi:SAM-dependent methyltransferase
MNTFTMSDVQRFWDGISDIYDETNARIGSVHTQRFTEALKYLSLTDDKKVFNIWSRSGGAIPFLRAVNKRFYLINGELSFGMVRKSKINHPDELFLQCSLHDFPLPNDIFDCVLSLETLEHVPDPVLFIKEVKRVLKPGGICVLSTPPALAEYMRLLYELFSHDHGEGPHRFLPSREVKKVISKAELDLLEHRGTVFIPFDYPLLRRLDAWFERIMQFGFLKAFGIRQFYIFKKGVQ